MKGIMIGIMLVISLVMGFNTDKIFKEERPLPPYNPKLYLKDLGSRCTCSTPEVECSVWCKSGPCQCLCDGKKCVCGCIEKLQQNEGPNDSKRTINTNVPAVSVTREQYKNWERQAEILYRHSDDKWCKASLEILRDMVRLLLEKDYQTYREQVKLLYESMGKITSEDAKRELNAYFASVNDSYRI